MKHENLMRNVDARRGFQFRIGELAFNTEIRNDEDGDVMRLCVGSVVTHTKDRNV